MDLSGDKPRAVFRWRQLTPRILASNTKLFTTTAALSRFGTDGTLGTEVLGKGELDTEGVFRGGLYLRGGGDPTFGSRRFTTRSYGGGATVQDLAVLLEEIGIERVTGRVFGDESAFDSLRGGPESGYGVSPWVGPLSALSYNRGLFTESGRGYQANPPAFAAARLDEALEARGVTVRLKPRAGLTPKDARVLASVDSPPMSRLIRLTNKPSDNFFAEMLLKDLADQAGGAGTTPRVPGSRPPTPAGSARAPRSPTAPGCRAATAPRPRASSGCSPPCTGARTTTCSWTHYRSRVVTAPSSTACGAARPGTAAAGRPARSRT